MTCAPGGCGCGHDGHQHGGHDDSQHETETSAGCCGGPPMNDGNANLAERT